MGADHYMTCDPDNSTFGTIKQLDKFEIDYTGVFDLAHFYKGLHDWLCFDEGWVASDGAGSTDDHVEYSYVENDLGNGLKSHNIWWRFKQIPDKSEYFMFMVHLNLQTVAMGKTEIVQGDKKLTKDKGELIVRGKIYYIHDYKGGWKDNSFLEKFQKMFKNRIYGEQLGHYKNRLLDFSTRLQDYIKQYLQVANRSSEGVEQYFSPR